jgi:surfeit locus 1 family protein
VILKGKWDTEHMMLLGPRVRDGSQGYNLVVPLVRKDGSTVIVDRGFISKSLSKDYSLPDAESEVEVIGLLRTSQKRNTFTPNNSPDQGLWFWVDIDAMAEFSGGSGARVQPVFVEEVFGQSRFSNQWLRLCFNCNRWTLRRCSIAACKWLTYW